MGAASRFWSQLAGFPDPRSHGEIADEIEAELAFHLEQSEREFIAEGMSPQSARETALRRFGNFEKVRAECKRVQLGGRVMLQRFTLGVLVVLLAAVVVLGWRSVAAQQQAGEEMAALRAELSAMAKSLSVGAQQHASPANDERALLEGKITNYLSTQRMVPNAPQGAEETTSFETWSSRFQAAADPGGDSAAVARRLRDKCSLDRAVEVLQSIWPRLGADQRLVLLDVLVESNSERLVRCVVHLGATDADPRVSMRAFVLLRELTFIRFDHDSLAEYLSWYTANKDLGLSDIAEKAAPALVKELLSFGSWNETCALYSPLNLHMSFPGAYAYPELLREAGAIKLITAWAGDPDPRARVGAVRWLEAAKIDEVTARTIIMPMLADPGPRDPALMPAVCQALVSLECTWAWEPLLDSLGSTMRSKHPTREQLEPIAAALGHMESARVVPTILAWIALANDPVATEVLGREALEPLVGVDFDPAHDVNWWLNWWSINRAQYPIGKNTETGLPLVSYF